jgi:hypothetical protein
MWVCSALPRRQRAAVVLRFYEDLACLGCHGGFAYAARLAGSADPRG